MRSRGTAGSELRRVLWGDGAARTRTLIALLLLVACVVYLLVVHASGIETEVIRDRYWKNAVPLFEGTVPVTEYPPLALVFIAVPYLFGSTPWGYETAYVGMMYVVSVAGLCLVSRLASRTGHDPKVPMVVYGVLTLLMLEFVLDRFDMIAMVLTLAAVVMFAERRIPLSFVLLALGVLTKVYPVILFPVLTIALLADRRYRDAAVGFGAFAATGIAAVAVCWLMDPDIITNFIQYNGDRPLQIESVAASLIYPLSLLGISDMWIQGSSAESFWSDNLRGDLPDAVAGAMMGVMAALIVVVWLFYAWARRRAGGDFDMRLMALAMAACLLAFMVSNKVFSSQYLIWLIGPAAMLAMYSARGFQSSLFRTLVLALVLTQVNFAYNVGYLGGGPNIDALGMAVVLARNLVVVLALWLVAREILREARRTAVPGGSRTAEGSS